MKQLLLLFTLLIGVACYGQDSNSIKPSTYTDSQGHVYQLETGPRGGKYYKDEKGEKHYPSSEWKKEPPSNANLITGPRGGQYWIDEKGSKHYTKHKK